MIERDLSVIGRILLFVTYSTLFLCCDNDSKLSFQDHYWLSTVVDEEDAVYKAYSRYQFSQNDSLYVTGITGELKYVFPYSIVDHNGLMQIKAPGCWTDFFVQSDSIIKMSGNKGLLHKSKCEPLDIDQYNEYLSGKEFVLGYEYSGAFGYFERNRVRYVFGKNGTCSLVLETETRKDSIPYISYEELLKDFNYVIERDSIILPSPYTDTRFVKWHINQVTGLYSNKLLINHKHEI